LVRNHCLGPEHWELGLAFEPQTLDDKRAIIALVYGDSDLHQANQRRRQRRIGLLEGLQFLIEKAFTNGYENFAFLTRLFFTRLRARLQTLLTWSISEPRDIRKTP
jgi:hypothetical protein